MKYLYGFLSLGWLTALIALLYFDYQPNKFTIGGAFFLLTLYTLIDAVSYRKEAE